MALSRVLWLWIVEHWKLWGIPSIVAAAATVVGRVYKLRKERAEALAAKAVLRREDAAHRSADATKASADVLANAERAWVIVEIQAQEHGWITLHTNQDSIQRIGIAARCVCRNAGRSVAWITEKWAEAKVVNVIPPHPSFSDKDKIFQHSMQQIAAGAGDAGYNLWFEVLDTHTPPKRKPILLYGYVKYRTIFDNREGETRFGYIISPMNSLERLPSEYAEYNSNT